MTADTIDRALEQVQRLQEVILERRRFRGFSGEARIASGFVALVATVALASGLVPAREIAHLVVWGGVLAVGVVSNYGALAHWFLHNPGRRRDLLALKPAVEVIPAYAMGAALSWALVREGQYDLLFGVWMCGHGLAHAACRLALPKANFHVGLAYLACGAACLVAPACSLLNPWPMGLMFGVGEMVGGAILIRDRRADGDDAHED